MGKDKQHVVVGNGVIRSKAEIAEFKKRLDGEEAAEEVVEEAAVDEEAGGTPNGTDASILESVVYDGNATPGRQKQ